MDQDDTPLLHFPDLIRALLRAGRDAPATLVDAAARLAAERDRVHESSRVDLGELATHLDHARRHLLAAHALEMLDATRYRTTPRGRALLRGHPDGVDDGVLMEFPEFRSWMKQLARHPPPEDPRPREFLDGWAASWRGCALDDNPFASDTAQHDAWADGWLEADRRRQEQV